MLVVHVQVRVRPGRVEDFLAATLVNARASLAEPGVVRFDVLQDQADPAHVILTEVYRDEEASAAHKLTPHYAAWRDSVAEMMGGAARIGQVLGGIPARRTRLGERPALRATESGFAAPGRAAI
jgi:(4S)-4-hydroxy-5-phosphonooxypentane-2,3-dione isomerase